MSGTSMPGKCYVHNIQPGTFPQPIQFVFTEKKFPDLNGDRIPEKEVKVINPRFKRNDSIPNCAKYPPYYTRTEIYFSDGPTISMAHGPINFIQVDNAPFHLTPTLSVRRGDLISFDRYKVGETYRIINISAIPEGKGLEIYFNLENISAEKGIIQKGVLEFVASPDELRQEATLVSLK